MIDLRSDTVTKPTAGMRRAMAEAEVDDHVIGTDPTVAKLEAATAERLGKEAALFVPSGTMANLVAVRVHCHPGDELVCEASSHVIVYEQAGYAQIAGVAARTFPGKRGAMATEALEGCVRPANDHFARTRLLWLENTHNNGGGSVLPWDVVRAQTAWAARHGLRRHLDGARLWNAAAVSGIGLAQWAACFDTVSVCFSKGLGAPAGSALVGPEELIRQASRHRKVLGGAMRQSGVLAAAALYALKHHLPALPEDHAKARLLADAVRENPRLELVFDPVDTNMVFFRSAPEDGRSEAALVAALAEQKVAALTSGRSVRLVTHRDVDLDAVRQAAGIVARL